MEKKIIDILSKKLFENCKFDFNTPYGNMKIIYFSNKLSIVNFLENNSWKNRGCKDQFTIKINKINEILYNNASENWHHNNLNDILDDYKKFISNL